MKLGAILFIPFVLVSVIRRVANMPRPSEIFDFEAYGMDVRGFRTGRSFPSRHVFSGFLIGAALLPYLPVLGVAILVLSTALGAARVLLGFHFLRDVIAGALIGVISAVTGLLIIGI